MSRKILFSPVGGTDPIKYSRDGSMLHICRYYQPDIVYLYLSHEIMEYHRKDNRYVDAIEKLGEYLGHTFEVRLIERDMLIDVQQYDVFYMDFREEIRKIENDMEEGDELFVNMASGTPAMKSALLIMATLAEYRFHAIQVSTPQQKMNSDRDNYDKQSNWESNRDNHPGAPDRCEEVQCFNLIKLLKVEAIKKHILAYDYHAALSVAEEIKADISEDAYRLLQIAAARIKLDERRVTSLMREEEFRHKNCVGGSHVQASLSGAPGRGKYDIYPVREGNKRKIFEYVLALEIKIKRQEYSDFIRGITPVVVDLLENILKNECGILISDCCDTDIKTGAKHWNKWKLEKRGLLDLLNKQYGGEFRLGPVYSGHIAKIIEAKCRDMQLVKNVKKIAAVEGAVRNPAAHEIVSVTDSWIQAKTNKRIASEQEIFSIIRYLTEKAGIHVSQEDWRSYDKMNEMIVSCLH